MQDTRSRCRWSFEKPIVQQLFSLAVVLLHARGPASAFLPLVRWARSTAWNIALHDGGRGNEVSRKYRCETQGQDD